MRTLSSFEIEHGYLHCKKCNNICLSPVCSDCKPVVIETPYGTWREVNVFAGKVDFDEFKEYELNNPFPNKHD